jgi:hypothetical protein
MGLPKVNPLRRSLAASHSIINAGMNGDCAWNVDQKLPEVLALQPEATVLLIGTN